MSISVDHRLSCATHFHSPHFNARPHGELSLIVVHCISLPEGAYNTPHIKDLFLGSLNTQAHSSFAPLHGLRVSAHVLIKRCGEVEQYVPFNARAWHAGVSHYLGRENCNDFSIGIELEGCINDVYTEAQYKALVKVCRALIAHYPTLSPHAITGHSHIAPMRKQDPGPYFDWLGFKLQLAVALAKNAHKGGTS